MPDENTLDDVKLDISPAEELALMDELDDEAPEDEVVDDPVTPADDEPEADEPEAPEAPAPAENDVLKALQEERMRLQEQLQALAATSAADRDRLALLEKAIISGKIKEPDPTPEPTGPSPEQIAAYLDGRIADLDGKLAVAEAEDPAAAPALRKQLRQLERYYNNYVTQQVAAQAPDPQTVVQRAVEETQQQQRFNQAKMNIINEFPMLNPNSQHFDAALRDQIYKFYQPRLHAGDDPTDAFVDAVVYVTRANGIMPQSEAARYEATKVQQQQEAVAKAASKGKTSEAATQRKADAVKKNVAAAGATPPNIADAGAPNTSDGILGKYDFSAMSIDEMMRLTPDQERQIEEALRLHDTL